MFNFAYITIISSKIQSYYTFIMNWYIIIDNIIFVFVIIKTSNLIGHLAYFNDV